MAIRELTKSMLSFSWAMSLFPVQQTLNILQPAKAAKSFNHVTEATREELGDALEAAFKAGDNLQQGLVDLTFGVFTLQAFNPSSWAKATADVVQRTARATSDVAQQTARSTSEVAEQTARATSGVAEQTAKATSGFAEQAARATSDAAQQAAGTFTTPGAARGGKR